MANETKTRKAKSNTPALDALVTPAAKTWREAVDNILTDVAKSAHKTVVEGTANILKTLQQSAHNWFACGQYLIGIAEAINERQFTRMVNEVFSRFGLSKSTAYRWMGNVEVLSKAVPYEPARDALLTVFNGEGLVSRKDKEAAMTGPVALGIKKHPVPTVGTYHECMDWAREVQLVAEKSAPAKQSMEEVYKSLRERFKKLTSKRYDLAVELCIDCYRHLEATSEFLAAAAFEAFEDSSIAPADAGKNALAAIKKSQQQGEVIRRENANTATVRAA